MTQLGINCSIMGKVSHAECRACAMDGHPCEYPPDFLEMMREENNVQHDRTEFTPSTLLECDRRTALRTSSDYWVDPAHQWNLIRGGMVHALIEQRGKYPPNSVVDVIREVRLTTKVETKYGPQVFSGKPDLIVVERVVDGTAYIKVVDYKTKSIDHSLTYADRKHQMQLNLYAFLAQRELPRRILPTSEMVISNDGTYIPRLYAPIRRVEVTELEVDYVDMKKVRRFTSLKPLYTRGKLINRSTWEYDTLELAPVFMLPYTLTESWVVQRIEEKIHAKEELPPPLEGDEAWVCPYCPLRSTCFELAGKTV